MRTVRTTQILLSLCFALNAFGAKNDTGDYLRTRSFEASQKCRDYITSTAKDPTSIKFEGQDEYSTGHAFTKNDIFVYLKVWGKNSYGATLIHNITCTARCRKDYPCYVQGTEEMQR